MGFLDKVKDAVVSPVAPLLGFGLGGAGKGGSKSNTQTITNMPWNAEQLQYLQEQAKQQYEAGPNQYYPQSTVAEMNPQLQATLNQLMGFSGTGNVQAGQGALNEALAGMGGLRQQAMGEQVSGIGDYASFLMNQGMGGAGGAVGGIAGQADPTAAFQQFLGNSAQNPYVDQLVQNVTGDISRNLNENIMPRIDQGSLANNAYGGSRQGIAQGKAIEGANRQASDAATSIRAGAYESDQNRKLSAANSMLGAAGQGDQYGLALQQLGLSGANMGRGLFQDLSGVTGQLASMAPLMQAYEGMNLNTQMQGGQAQQQYLQSLLNDKVNRFNFDQNADAQNLNQYADILFRSGGMGGTQTQTTPQPEKSFMESLLGGASTGLGAYGMASAAGIPFAGPLAIALGGLSAFG